MVRILFSTLFCLPFFLLSQNLVPNSGFENHGELRGVGFHSPEKFQELVPGWTCPGSHVNLFTKNYTPNPDELKRGYDLKKYPPFDGKASVLLDYGLSTPNFQISVADYVQTKFSKPLKKGEYYQVSFAVFINDTDGIKNNPQFAQHFGISFSNQKFQRKKKGQKTIEDYSPFLIQNSRLNQWFSINYILCPTIDLEYLVIGAFENFYTPFRFAGISSANVFEFFVDEIRVEKIELNLQESQEKAIHFPFLTPLVSPEKPALENIFEIIYFDTKVDEISTTSSKKLDNLILKMSPHGMYKIEGHTDNIGDDNIVLSRKRAEAIRNYLVENGNVSIEQFSIESLADTKPRADNNSESNRKLNRRGEIQTVENFFQNKLFPLATAAASAGKIDSAFYFLQKLVKIKSFPGITLLHEPVFEPLRTHPKWKALRFFIKDSYKIYKEGDLAFAWEELFFQPDSPEKLKKAMQLLDKNGFPNPVEVSIRAASAPLDILIKNGDKKTLKKYFSTTKKAFTAGFISEEKFKAFLEKVKSLK